MQFLAVTGLPQAVAPATEQVREAGMIMVLYVLERSLIARVAVPVHAAWKSPGSQSEPYLPNRLAPRIAFPGGHGQGAVPRPILPGGLLDAPGIGLIIQGEAGHFSGSILPREGIDDPIQYPPPGRIVGVGRNLVPVQVTSRSPPVPGVSLRSRRREIHGRAPILSIFRMSGPWRAPNFPGSINF